MSKSGVSKISDRPISFLVVKEVDNRQLELIFVCGGSEMNGVKVLSSTNSQHLTLSNEMFTN